jgi:hypothetical protein
MEKTDCQWTLFCEDANIDTEKATKLKEDSNIHVNTLARRVVVPFSQKLQQTQII